MVSYCCVKGCKNNSNDKRKNPNVNTSFHFFPANQEARMKWLKAIGRPNWDPPIYARVCSAHLTPDQINLKTTCPRIKDDAFPISVLPTNSDSVVSDLEVCRFCLATDIKMYSLQHQIIKHYIETVLGINENISIEGLPQYACYECATHLKKCSILIEKCMTSQAILLDLLAQNGQITKSLVQNVNRESLNLQSSLTYHKKIPTYLFVFEYDNGKKIPNSTPNNIETEYLEDEIEMDYETVSEYLEDDTIAVYLEEFKGDIKLGEENCIKVDTDCEYSPKIYVGEGNEIIDTAKEIDNDDVDNAKDNEEDSDAINYSNGFKEDMSPDKASCGRPGKMKIDLSQFVAKHMKVTGPLANGISDITDNENETSNIMSDGDQTEEEVKFSNGYKIVKLTTLEEQIQEWKKSTENPSWLNKPSFINKSQRVYTCELCSKMFAYINTYKLHLNCHDPNNGDVECPVCKIRLDNDRKVKAHISRVHSRKYYCKSCPKAFTNINTATTHLKMHSGHSYRCSRCPFSSKHKSAISSHVQRQHAHAHACALCGRACVTAGGLELHRAYVHRTRPDTEEKTDNQFQCDQCNLSFQTEGARRVHILTSKQHRNSTTAKELSRKNTCRVCGRDFPSSSELYAHAKAEHRTRSKNASKIDYPNHCEHCGKTVNTRREHWLHVRRQHPSESQGYRRDITAVCITCGKGYQNLTKLKIHELRHRSPSLTCDVCGRLFYDKYVLTYHLSHTHGAERPYVCPHCPKTFKVKANRNRHIRIHTGETPYECSFCSRKFGDSTRLKLHVRTVHCGLPHPPKKNRRQKEIKL